MAIETMEEGMPVAGQEATQAPPTEETESPSIFLSQETLGGKKVKKGDTLTLKVIDIDPESGDVQADLVGGGETSMQSGPIEDDFEKEMPSDESEGEGY